MELKSARQGKKLGVGRKLSKEQDAEIFKLICSKRPWQVSFKLPYREARLSLWNRDLVMQLVNKKYGIKLSDGGVVNHLKRWGFPVLNMKKQKNEGCTRIIQNWLQLHYSSIEERAQLQDAMIVWVSKKKMSNPEAGMVCESKRRYQLSMVTLILKQGKVHWLVIKGQFTPEKQIALLKAVLGEFKETIFLIRNNSEHFTSPQVMRWIDENRSRIELFPPPEWQPEAEELCAL